MVQRGHQDRAQAVARRPRAAPSRALHAALAQLVDVVDQHDAVVHHDPDQDQEPDLGHQVERRAGERSRSTRCPTNANGSASMIANGWSSDSNSAAITR